MSPEEEFSGMAVSRRSPNREKGGQAPCPRVGIYAGAGSSHSWLWFVELFDRMGLHDLVFLDEEGVKEGGLIALDALAVSGGDTFAMAKGLGAVGAESLKSFVEGGGIYIGSCAGAYLLMKSSKEPLHLFNFVDVKITNLSRILPKAERMPQKFCTAYGCDFIFHPVREEVRLRMTRRSPFSGGSFAAPLYGGPGMIAMEGVEVLAAYEAFTDKTLFMVDRALAEKILIGKAAALRAREGKGWYYLLGPHFEHPYYPEANRFVTDTVLRHAPERRERPAGRRGAFEDVGGREFLRDLKREISNARIVARSMEMLPLYWTIGAKVYEPEKIGVFLEAVWRRLRHLEGLEKITMREGAAERLLSSARETTLLLRRVKVGNGEGRDTHDSAKELFSLLHRLTVLFMEIHFGNRPRS